MPSEGTVLLMFWLSVSKKHEHYTGQMSLSGDSVSLRFLFAKNRVNECYWDLSTIIGPNLSSCPQRGNQTGHTVGPMNDPGASTHTISLEFDLHNLRRQSPRESPTVTKLASRRVTRHRDVGQSPSPPRRVNLRPTRLLPLLRRRVLLRLLSPKPTRRR